VLFGFDWLLAVFWIVLWLFTALLFRYSSLAALVATLLTVVVSWPILYDWISYRESDIYIFIAIAIITVFMFWRHRENIKKLIAGTESRIGSK
jgi:glycerol-3-phosphate acyltransferase PlsY